MRILAAAMLLAPAAASCGAQGEEIELRPRSHPLVDNLFLERRTGDVSAANLANGTFRLSGRCLTVDTGEGARTPVLALPSGGVTLSASGIALGDRPSFEYGRLYALPGAVPGPRLDAGPAGRCPRDTLVVRGSQPLQDIPQPNMPPLTPEPR